MPDSDSCAVEILNPGAEGLVVLSCEHASNALPPWIQPSQQDLPWLETHWGHDLGGAAITREMARILEAPAILARFSRLVCDPNRSPSDPTWIRSRVEQHPLDFNQELGPEERVRRALSLYVPYHAAFDRLLVERLARGHRTMIFSVHTYTPIYEGQVRSMEMGVLYDRHEPLAERMAAGLSKAGFETALNAPWSGREGLAYSPDRHGRAHHMPYLEIEVRQDLVSSAEGAAWIARVLSEVLLPIAEEVAV